MSNFVSGSFSSRHRLDYVMTVFTKPRPFFSKVVCTPRDLKFSTCFVPICFVLPKRSPPQLDLEGTCPVIFRVLVVYCHSARGNSPPTFPLGSYNRLARAAQPDHACDKRLAGSASRLFGGTNACRDLQSIAIAMQEHSSLLLWRLHSIQFPLTPLSLFCPGGYISSFYPY
jgi:hypothetical protein